MEEQEESYFAVIPAPVLHDSELTANIKILYANISYKCNGLGYCWAENAYFAKKHGVDVCTISRWISKLEKRGHVYLELLSGNKRKIFIANVSVKGMIKKSSTLDAKVKRPLTQKSSALDAKVKSIYENNNIKNNKEEKEESALAFFEENYPSQFEVLMIQFKKQINDFVSFSASFNATVEMEGLPYELHVLSGRFKKYAHNWIRNQKKYDADVTPEAPKKKFKSPE